MTLVAGVDTSTQSCKVVIVEATTGAVVREGRAPHPDGTEVDPEAWWRALLQASHQAGGLADVEAISIGGQQHGLVALDAEGRVIRKALLWNDTRSAGAASDLIGEIGAAEYASRTGLVPVASFTATKVRWLRDHEPENTARLAAVCLPHDWLTWRLRGYGPQGESPLGPDLDQLVTDRSDASGTAYWSVSAESYDLDLFRVTSGRSAREADRSTVQGQAEPLVILPRVLGPHESTAVDAMTDELGIKTGTLVGPGAGDNAAAALGLGAREGDVVVSIGTSGTVFAVTPRAVIDSSGAAAGFADATGLFLPLIATLNAARVLDAMATVLGVDHEGLADLALAAQPGAGGVVLLPYFEGERTPNLPHATASMIGMTLATTTRENVARAAVEGLLCGLADGLAALTRLGVEPRRVLLIGGGARNRAVPPIASEILGLPVVVPEPGEYVALGAARQAAWVLHRQLPQWELSVSTTVSESPRPEIRQAYRAAFTQVMR